MDILEKLDIFTNEETVGNRPIQFMKWWNDFRPGDRADVEMGDGYVSIIGSDGEGYFAGVKKEVVIEDEMEIDNFLKSQRDIWNYV